MTYSKLRDTIPANPLVVITFLAYAVLQIFAFTSPAMADAPAGWDAGNIISDQVFTNSNSMTAAQIQTFLNSKVPTCDTWGTQPSEFGGGTRAQWAAARGYYPPFTCLKDYTENGLSAAQIIYNAAQNYGINPQVLLVLLQKEQGLVTDTWPLSIQYTSATGYRCPDSGSCDPAYAGLTKQLNGAASDWQYAMTPGSGFWSQFILYANNNILYNPDTSCGSGSVYIASRATWALYTYTPYQPNSAALNAAMGQTVSCGAYGNLNFYRYYTSWFGSTHDNSPLYASNVTANTTHAGVGQGVSVSYTVTNPNSYPITVPSIGVSNRMNGGFYDFNITKNVSFAANETKTFTGTYYPGATGTYGMTVAYNYNNNWWTGNTTYVKVDKPSLSVTQPINITPEFPLVGSSHTLAFQVKNTGSVEADLTYLMAADTSNGAAFGYSAASPVILTPGQTYTYTTTRTATDTNNQVAWVSYMLPTGEWFQVGNTTSFRSYSSPASLSLSTSLTTTPSNPVINTPITATYTIKNSGDQPIRYNNIGVQVRRASDNANLDYSSQPNGTSIVIPSKGSYTYTSSRALPTKDTYNYQITSSKDGTSWSTSDFGATAQNSNASIQTYSSPANVSITSPISLTAKKQGELIPLTYTVKNTGDQPTGPMSIAFYCRFEGQYCDIPGDVVNLQSGQSATVTRVVSFTSPGSYTIQPLRHWNNGWENFGTAANSTIQSFTPDQSTFTTSLSLDTQTVTAGQPVTATYTIRNNTAYDLQVPRFAVASRLNGFYDFGFQNWFFIRAGQTLTFSAQFTPTVKGTYTLFPVLLLNDNWLGYSTTSLTVQ